VCQFFTQTNQKADVKENRKTVAPASLEDKAMLKGNQLGRRESTGADKSRDVLFHLGGGEKQEEGLQLVLNKCENG
jgi:hypothetical protein